MQISTILFDLDETLLPMDLNIFIKGYLNILAEKMAPHGYEPEQLIDTIWSGMKAMILNDGTYTNETVFWNKFSEVYGDKAKTDKKIFDDFYDNDFNLAQKYCGVNPKVPSIIEKLKKEGYRLILATSPIFPAAATYNRIKWAGLKPNDFEYISTYENSNYSKPNLKYYQELIDKLKIDPKSCLMIGNNVDEDMIASELGVSVFLLTDDLINKSNSDISKYAKGGTDELIEYLNKLNI